MKLIQTLGMLALALGISVAAHAADKSTWTGTLVDSSCYLEDSSHTGNEHDGMKNCGTECLQKGSPAGLLTQDKQYFTLVTPAPALAKYVGQTVRVSGEAHNGAILPSKLEVKKGEKWEAVPLKGMM